MCLHDLRWRKYTLSLRKNAKNNYPLEAQDGKNAV